MGALSGQAPPAGGPPAPGVGGGRGAAPRPVAHARPLLVEFVGLAGAGKSTLLAEMRRRRTDIRWLQRARASRHAPLAVREAIAFAPAFLAAIPSAPGFTWRTARYYVRLETLRHVVEHELHRSDGPLVLEHGPVYTLARIAASADAPVPGPLARYAARSLARWAPMLHLVVALAAAPDVLAGRVRERPKAHPMRTSTASEMGDFLSRYNQAYAAVLADLAATGGPPVLTLRTDEESVPTMVGRLLAALEDPGRAR
jgi:hypothetical protein